ncbi:MAG: Lrp/AsnC family transcriptional regulator [Alphaproteobacteria bacterium]|nr:MAG: Lrp/AsnC family transcriptional regulator [Alphaproteobacteria bacterium]
MDDTDKQLLSLLGANARASVSTLARRLGVARSTVQARLERLERSGTIAGYTVRLGDAARAERIRATVLIQLEPRATPQVLRRLQPMTAVERVHTTSGRFDLILEVAADTTRDLDAILDEIGAVPGVRSSESLIHLSTRIDRAL